MYRKLVCWWRLLLTCYARQKATGLRLSTWSNSREERPWVLLYSHEWCSLDVSSSRDQRSYAIYATLLIGCKSMAPTWVLLMEQLTAWERPLRVLPMLALFVPGQA